MKVNPVSYVQSFLPSRPVGPWAPWVVTAAKASLVLSTLAIAAYLIYSIKNRFNPRPDGTPSSVPLDPVKKEGPFTPSKPNQGDSTPSNPSRPSPRTWSKATTLTRKPQDYSSMTPNTKQFNLIKEMMNNPPLIAIQPVFITEGAAHIALTEDLLKKLETFFASFSKEAVWEDTIHADPYLCCALLEDYPGTYQYRDEKDKGRIRILLQNYQNEKEKAVSDPTLKALFYVNSQVTFQKLDTLHQFLDDFLLVQKANRAQWLKTNYKESDDHFSWLDLLEKKHPSPPEEGTLKNVLQKYSQARTVISKHPELADYIEMEPLTIQFNTETLSVDWPLLWEIKTFLTLSKRKSQSRYTAQDYIAICEKLQNNPQIYDKRPEFIREFIESLKDSYIQNLRRISRANINTTEQ